MKTLTCDLCDHEAKGETFAEWMSALKPHYAEAHADFMQQQAGGSADEQQAGMQQWMADARSRFEAQPDDT